MIIHYQKIKYLVPRLALSVICALAAINAIMIGSWNASINPSQSGRFMVGAIIGALYVLVPSLLIFFLIYRSKAKAATTFRLLMWLPLFIWGIAFYDGMGQIVSYILMPIYFSYGIFPAAYYTTLEIVRRKTTIKRKVRFGEWLASAILFVFINLAIYYLTLALSGFASQGAGTR